VKNYTYALILLLSSCTFEQVNDDDVVIYTSRQPQLIENLLSVFTEETGINVTVLSGDAQQLMERIAVEGKDTDADIFMTVDAGVLWQAGDKGIFDSVESEVLSERIPEHLRDTDNEWFGFSKRARTIVYSKADIDPKDLSTYEALALKDFENKLCLRTSKKVYNRSLIASMIEANGAERTERVVKGWVKNLAEPVFSSDTNVLKAVEAGNCKLTVVNTYYLARLIESNSVENLGIFWANQEDRGVHVNISGAGLVKWSKNKDSSIQLLEWLSSDIAQDMYARANKEYPTVDGIALHPVIEAWGDFKEDLIQVDKLGSMQSDAVFIAQTAGYN
tara:strand:- start:2165 stop:3163 length:999 start_codon:yes stop_codon:yes gene_type:complete